jgi:hypothetical protein
MKFSGKFKGCVKETVVCSKGVSEMEYKAELKVKSVNCSQKTAYLIDIKDHTGETQNLAFLENFERPVLRSPTAGVDGLTSTYFEGKYLIHQVSSVSTNSRGEKVWVVKYYKLRECC